MCLVMVKLNLLLHDVQLCVHLEMISCLALNQNVAWNSYILSYRIYSNVVIDHVFLTFFLAIVSLFNIKYTNFMDINPLTAK